MIQTNVAGYTQSILTLFPTSISRIEPDYTRITMNFRIKSLLSCQFPLRCCHSKTRFPASLRFTLRGLQSPLQWFTRYIAGISPLLHVTVSNSPLFQDRAFESANLRSRKYVSPGPKSIRVRDTASSHQYLHGLQFCPRREVTRYS